MESILGDLILWVANLQRFIREYFPWIYFSAQFKLGMFPTYPFEYSPGEKYIQTFLCKWLFAVLNQLIFLFHFFVLCLYLCHYYWFLHFLCTYYWGGKANILLLEHIRLPPMYKEHFKNKYCNSFIENSATKKEMGFRLHKFSWTK